ncbi:MAG TPA: hypothetical protein VN704_04080 [Verrucomicrobiae bacterium]|nr:hypothetical protein [Verrucomicrobiae bacterium]
MFVIAHFLSNIVEGYGEHLVSADDGTWYPQAFKVSNLYHHLHTSYEKSIIERIM